MLWLSGFSYAVSDMGKKLGCTEGVGQLFLIESLNAKFEGVNITAEQATEHLVKVLEKSRCCNPYNKRLQSDKVPATRALCR